MNSSNGKFAGRAVAEFALIVVGVLVAFQVEEARERADLREREMLQLEALRSDFDLNREQLESHYQTLQRLVGARAELLTIVHEARPHPPPDSLIELVSRTLEFRSFEARSGAYDALVGSGDLRLIRNAELRTSLARFYSDAGLGYGDRGLSDLVRTELINAIAEQTDLLAVMRPRWRELASLPRSSIAPNYKALLADQVFLSRVAVLSYIESGRLRYFERLLGQAEDILGLLANELGAVSI